MPAFDEVCDLLADRAFAWDLRKRPVRRRRSDDDVLDPETAIVASCEPREFRRLTRDWQVRDGRHRLGADEITEAMHELDLERAAQPPVIEVTVTTPPDGIPRLELARLVTETVREFTGPQPVLRDGGTPAPPGRRKMLLATRRVRSRLGRRLPDVPPLLPVSEDDTPTEELPAITDGFELVEVHLP